MSEFAPGGSNAKMTKAQVKKYVADIKKAQAIAEEKLRRAKDSWEFKKEEEELEELENLLDI